MDLGNSQWLLWLAVALVAGTVEILTLDLIFLMMAGGGVAAAVAAAFGAPLALSVAVFAGASGLLLVAARPPLLHYVRRAVPASQTGTAALVGQEARVLVEVTATTSGRVQLAGEVWSARSVPAALGPATRLEVGQRVSVVRIDGATAVVAPLVGPGVAGASPAAGPDAAQ